MRVRTYDPFRQFDRLLTPSAATVGPRIPLDVVHSDDNVTLSFDLPGYAADSIELTVEKRELVLRAERSFQAVDGHEVVRSERRHGAVSRRLLLAENLDTEAMSADYTDGVLTVTIPVVAAAKPRKIEIGGTQAALES